MLYWCFLMMLSHIKGQPCLLPCVHQGFAFLINLWMVISCQLLYHASALFSITPMSYSFTEHFSIILMFKIQIKMSLDKSLNLIHTHSLWYSLFYWIHESRFSLNGRLEEEKGLFRLLWRTEWSSKKFCKSLRGTLWPLRRLCWLENLKLTDSFFGSFHK